MLFRLPSYRKHFSDITLRRGAQPQTAVGSPIVNLGTFESTLTWILQGKVKSTVTTVVNVLEDLHQPVLSKETQIKMGMLPAGYPHVQVQQVAAH